jgi:hypothetical protein
LHAGVLTTGFLVLHHLLGGSVRRLRLLGAFAGGFLLVYCFDGLVYRLQKFHLSAPLAMSFRGHFDEWVSLARFSGIPALLPLSLSLALALCAWLGSGLVFVHPAGPVSAAKDAKQRRARGWLRKLPSAAVLLSFFALLVLQAGEQWASSRLGELAFWRVQRDCLWLYPPFFPPQLESLVELEGPIVPALEPAVESIDPVRAELPDQNLLLVVLETFRGDFVTPQGTPRLSRFATEEALRFDETLANGNSTDQGWFALFQGLHSVRAAGPALLPERADQGTRGSPFLRILKQNGFKIHGYSASFVHYLNHSSRIFGSFRGGGLPALAETFELHSRGAAWKNDQLVTQRLTDALDRKGRNAFILFLESGHFPYDFPPDFPLRFKPAAARGELSAELFESRTESVRNRYRNAMAYVDSLWGKIEDHLKASGAYERTVIGIVGDHGEEFLEHGHRGHGYHLTQEQLRVPILIRAPGLPRQVGGMATQVDVFPTLLSALGIRLRQGGLDGLDLLRTRRTTALAFSRRAGFLGQDLYFTLKSAHRKASGFAELEGLDSREPRLRLRLDSVDSVRDEPIHRSLASSRAAATELSGAFTLSAQQLGLFTPDTHQLRAGLGSSPR